MSFDFNKNARKNFKFLKSIYDDRQYTLCSLDTGEGNSLYPFCRGLNDDDSVFKSYFEDECTLWFHYFNKAKANAAGIFFINLDEKNNKLIIDVDEEGGTTTLLSEDQLNNALKALTEWCQTTLLATDIEYLPGKNFVYPEDEFKKPNELILTAGPLVTHYENIYCYDAVNTGWNKEWSKYLDKFESDFANFVGSRYALATSSCTGALYLSLLACGIKEGDEVIVPELTWVATASAIKYTGAVPVFADVDLNTWCIETEHLESLLTKKTKAIMPVHLYGNPAEMNKIMSFAKNNNLKVIEDAAPAIGATYDNKKVGSFGDFGCFSFQGAKLLVTGEGGMVVTDNEELFSKFKKLWDHGRVPGTFWIDELGYKFKMSNLQAAFGLGQLENIETLIEAKRRNYSRYKTNLSNVEGIKLNQTGDNTESIYWMTSILLDQNLNISRDSFMEELKKLNIDTRSVFPSISQYPIWGKEYKENINSKLIGDNGINLPSGVNLTNNEIDYISNSVISLLENV